MKYGLGLTEMLICALIVFLSSIALEMLICALIVFLSFALPAYEEKEQHQEHVVGGPHGRGCRTSSSLGFTQRAT